MKKLRRLIAFSVLSILAFISLGSCSGPKLSSGQRDNMTKTLTNTLGFTDRISFINDYSNPSTVCKTDDGYYVYLKSPELHLFKYEYKNSNKSVTKTSISNETTTILSNVAFDSHKSFLTAVVKYEKADTNTDIIYSINQLYPYVRDLFLNAYSSDTFAYKEIADGYVQAGLVRSGKLLDDEFLNKLVGNLDKTDDNGNVICDYKFGFNIAEESYYTVNLLFNEDFTEVYPEISITCTTVTYYIFGYNIL